MRYIIYFPSIILAISFSAGVFPLGRIGSDDIPVLEPETSLGSPLQLVRDDPAFVDAAPHPAPPANGLCGKPVSVGKVGVSPGGDCPHAQSVIMVFLR